MSETEHERMDPEDLGTLGEMLSLGIQSSERLLHRRDALLVFGRVLLLDAHVAYIGKGPDFRQADLD